MSPGGASRGGRGRTRTWTSQSFKSRTAFQKAAWPGSPWDGGGLRAFQSRFMTLAVSGSSAVQTRRPSVVKAAGRQVDLSGQPTGQHATGKKFPGDRLDPRPAPGVAKEPDDATHLFWHVRQVVGF